MSKLFNTLSSLRENQAYKIYIEPYSNEGGAQSFLGYADLDRIAIDKLTVANKGYEKLWNESLINNGVIDYSLATVVADNNDDNSSLSFSYKATWEESKLADVVGDFIPNNITAGIGRGIVKTSNALSKVVTGSAAYHGTYPALNLNDRKLMAKPDFLDYEIKLKVVDKVGDGAVLKTLTKLLIYTAPQTIANEITLKQMLEAAIALGQKVINVGGKIIGIGSLIPSWLKEPAPVDETPDQARARGNEMIKNEPELESNLNKLAEELFGMEPKIELIGSPVPLRIFISDYFVHNLCVITNLSVDLSKQINTNGYPVYGTFNLSISSREKSPLDLGASDSADYPIPTVLRNITFGKTTNPNVRFQPQMLSGASFDGESSADRTARYKKEKEKAEAEKQKVADPKYMATNSFEFAPFDTSKGASVLDKNIVTVYNPPTKTP